MPFDDYVRAPGLNASKLKTGLKSMAHLQRELDGKGDEPSDAMKLGTLVHQALFESDAFAARPRFKGATKRTKAWREFVRDSPNGLHIDDAALATTIALHISRHPDVELMMGADGGCEASLFWHDQKHGIDMKGRLDYCVAGRNGYIMDLKTCSDITEDALQRAIWNFAYDVSAAHYLAGYAACVEEPPPPYFMLFAETSEPYAVRVFELSDESIHVGRLRRDQLLRDFVECRRTGQWWSQRPSQDIPQIGVPEWAVRRYAGSG